MPKFISIKVAEKIAKEQGCKQIIIAAFDNEGITHIVTYGSTIEDCKQAAQGGNFIKKALGWPEELCDTKPQRR